MSDMAVFNSDGECIPITIEGGKEVMVLRDRIAELEAVFSAANAVCDSRLANHSGFYIVGAEELLTLVGTINGVNDA